MSTTFSKTPLQVLKTITATNTPERLSATSKKFKFAKLTAVKALDGTTGKPTNNAQNIWYGFSASLVSSPKIGIVVAVGVTVELRPPDGYRWDLKDIAIVGTQDDGFLVEYQT